jgi:hypothetical protein
MLNVHFNGEIIRCPDQSGNYLKLVQRRQLEKRCQFGCAESDCETFNNWQLIDPRKRLNKGCCTLDIDPVVSYTDKETGEIIKNPESYPENSLLEWKKYICPKAQARYISAITPKKFKIDNVAYRKLSSAAHWMVKESFNKTLFLTLTFPKYLKDEITEKQANECFSKFTDSLKKTYSCDHYVAVRERGEENNRLHFHLICSLPYVHFGSLNHAWCSAIKDYCEYSNSAIQSRAGHRVIKNPIRSIRYVCKYISKSKGMKSDTRLYFISNCTLKKTIQIRSGYELNDTYKSITTKVSPPERVSESFNINEILQNYKSVDIKVFDYVTRFRIKDRIEFNKFCCSFIYPLFECSIKQTGLYFDTGNMN